MIDARLKHDLLNEINKLKQIVQLLAEQEEVPFSLEELKGDGEMTLEKMQKLWEKLELN